MKKILISVCIVISIVVSIMLESCSSKVEIKAVNLMDGIRMEKVEVDSQFDMKLQFSKMYKFYFDLFNSCNNVENTLISPLSLIFALGMTTNGADGNTLKEIEDTLGISISDLNNTLYSYMGKYGNTVAKLANSIWFKDEDDFSPNKDFLQINANYYNAGIYKAPFNNETIDDINNWTKQKTDGMIDKVLDNIPKEAVMYLINALAFNGEWEEKVSSEKVIKGIFTNIDSVEKNVEYLTTKESVYYEDSTCVGFEKDYLDGYSFKAFIPKDGVSFNDFVNSFDSEKYLDLLDSKSRDYMIYTKIPKFNFKYEIELIDNLKSLGINDIFSKDNANLTKLGSCKQGANLYVSKVLQKTFIDLDEKGTKAAAVTVIGINKATSVFDESQTKYIYLDEPFVFMICDPIGNPIFIGKYIKA